jgi:hypothetical protein
VSFFAGSEARALPFLANLEKACPKSVVIQTGRRALVSPLDTKGTKSRPSSLFPGTAPHVLFSMPWSIHPFNPSNVQVRKQQLMRRSLVG